MSSVTEVALGEVATVVRRTVDPHEIPDGTLYVGLENIERGGRFAGVQRVGPGVLASTKFTFGPAVVLFGKLRPYLAKIARPDFEGICSTDILPIEPGPMLDRDYLAHFLSRPDTVALAAERASGANLPRLSPSELEKFRMPVPSLGEQRQIARVLDAADALRATRRASLSDSGQLRRSWFLQTFASGAEAAWPTVTVEDLAAARRGAIRTGPFGSQLLHDEFVDEGIAVLGIDNVVANEFRWTRERYISDSKFRQLQRYTVHPGDLLITIMGTCGRAAIVPPDIPRAINTKHLCCITLDLERCLPVFLHAYFLNDPAATSHLRKNTKGAIMSGLNMGIIKSLPVRLPPIDVQRQFTSFAAALDEQEKRQRSHLAHLDTLFASLQSRAFKGEL